MRKGFRPTPNQFKNSIRIMSGNKTNVSIRDIEEKDDKELEEKEAIVVSIEKDKINGNGWTVQDGDGKTYKCSCQSNLYEVPKSKERGGLLYPTETVRCKIKINPVLNITTITEIITNDSKSSKDSKNSKNNSSTNTKLDISKWTHKDQDTTVIAKPMSAISISNGAITFNYDNKNKVTIDKEKTKIEGKVDLPASTTIGGEKPYTDEDLDKALRKDNVAKIKTSTYDYVNGNTNGKTIQATIQKAKADIFSKNKDEKVINNILDQKQSPDQKLNYTTISQAINENGEETGEIYFDEVQVYPDGVITIRTNNLGKRNIHCTQTWVTSYEKNIITITVSKFCDYCVYKINDTATYINYCPSCGAWNLLYENKGDIICQQCRTTYCGTCGHNNTNNQGDLKKYQDNYLIGFGENCEYCNDILEPRISKEYVNWCPYCKKWGTLIATTWEGNNKIANRIHCTNCDKYYCITCGISQLGYQPNTFDEGDGEKYANYIEKMKKIRYIKEN